MELPLHILRLLPRKQLVFLLQHGINCVNQLLTDIKLNITADMVLRGQGADPEIIRSRRPVLVQLAERAISEGNGFIKPVIITGKYAIKSTSSEGLQLGDGVILNSPLVAEHLQQSDWVVLAICTIGIELEEFMTRTGQMGDMALSLALDGLANAAVDQLSLHLCQKVEQEAAEEGLQTTIALGPGMLGWPLEIGQPQIFAALQPDPAIVKLLPSMLMLPRKSTSLAIGIGKQVRKIGKACQYCAVNATCRYHQELDKV